MLKELVARNNPYQAEKALKEAFKEILQDKWILDALFYDSLFNRLIGVANLPYKAPVVLELLKNAEIALFLTECVEKNGSILLVYQNYSIRLAAKEKNQIKDLLIPENLKKIILELLESVENWAGILNEKGEHVIDLKTPSPGPHFFVNLLIGNRINHSYPLQTTPKSVVDRLGRGSFRSHAATQVLATRWDMRQEENGFPANRQFYLVEKGKKIFYSADPLGENIESATCIHSQNHTTIQYKTMCGLEIKRLVFILPQADGLPIATEAQRIEIKNNSGSPRNLRLIYTGMFGSAKPPALFEDVLYSNIIMQARILQDESNSIVAISPENYSSFDKEDIRFHSMLVHTKEGFRFPTEFCTNYNEFVGTGTLENPESLVRLDNSLYRKGPGFFALASEINLEKDGLSTADQFTGLTSKKGNPHFTLDSFKEEIENLVTRFSKKEDLEKALYENIQFFVDYSRFIELKSSDNVFNTYFNKNLPFQVFYQTFVSRSFCQTQKGYREIGFREIQDIYATMYYFVSIDKKDFVKGLLKEWCAKVFEFGYAYHNFFWEGKEPGKWSDDALWLIQAVYRYINLSGDIGFLDEECPIAGTVPEKKRKVYETMKAILRYSGEISIGKHGIPLLDNADWNDCLKLDRNFIDGITKEKLYSKQIENDKGPEKPFESDYSESVMNGFLLKLAIDQTLYLSKEKGDKEYERYLSQLSEKIYDNLQKHAWKGDFFARILFNRYKNNEYTYLGAKGDHLSSDPKIDGSYFINSFSWAILSHSATEEQIEIILNTLESVLKTPFGIKLMSPTNLNLISESTAAGEYFPGDRENGAVFKHASMMATSAMFKAAKEVKRRELAIRLSRLAYWMVDLVLPYKTLQNPYVTCGNPRFCTQYNNSETGENIGPMLSGTSTWLILTFLSAFGVEYTRQGILCDPILKEEEKTLEYTVHANKTSYHFKISKPAGFYRIADSVYSVQIDDKKNDSNKIPLLDDQKAHFVEICFE
jgi:cellobiose phosphorylase